MSPAVYITLEPLDESTVTKMQREYTMKLLACCCVLLSLLSLSGCGNPDNLSKIASAPKCFKEVFQRQPPPSVLNLQGEGTQYRSADIYLRFQASKPALMTLIGTRTHFISRKRFIDEVGNAGDPPAWWKPLSGKPTLFITSSTSLYDPSYSKGNAYLTYDPATQIVCVYSEALD